MTKQFMLMYHLIKFGWKNTSSVDMVETVIVDLKSPPCDLDHEDSKQISLHDTLARDDASPYQVWKDIVQKNIH